jgi:hypothetical protein
MAAQGGVVGLGYTDDQRLTGDVRHDSGLSPRESDLTGADFDGNASQMPRVGASSTWPYLLRRREGQ